MPKPTEDLLIDETLMHSHKAADISDFNTSESDPLSLHLDQTTPQTIVNGVPLMTTDVDGDGSNTQLVNKKYVDMAVSSLQLTEYFSKSALSPAVTGFYSMDNSQASADTIDSPSITGTSGSPTSLFKFLTPVGHPHLDRFLVGVYESHFYLLRAAGGVVGIRFQVWRCDAAGTHIELLGTSADLQGFTTSNALYELVMATTTEVALVTTDRLSVEWLGWKVSGSNTTVTMTVGGTSDSHLSIKVEPSELQALFVPYTGAEHDVDLGAKNLLTSGTLGAGATTLTGALDLSENLIDNVGDITHDDAVASDWVFRNEDLDKNISVFANCGGVDTEILRTGTMTGLSTSSGTGGLGVGVNTGSFEAALDVVSLGYSTTILNFQDKATRRPLLALTQGGGGNCNLFLFRQSDGDVGVLFNGGGDSGQSNMLGSWSVGSRSQGTATARLTAIGARGIDCVDLTSPTFGSELLTNTALTSGTSWTSSGADCTLTGDNAVFAYVDGATSYFQQAAASYATPSTVSTWYKMTIVISGSTATAKGYPVLQVATTFGNMQFVGRDGTQTIYVKSNLAATTAFRIQATLVPGQGCTIESVSMLPITSGGLYTGGGGTIGLTLNPNGDGGLGGKMVTYNNIATVSGGVACERATVDLTGQTAAKSATTIYTPTASGMFRISISLQVTTAATTSSVLGGATGIVITYTEPDGSVAQSIAPLLTSQAGAVIVPATGNTGNTTTTQSQGSAVIYAKTGVAIQYAIGYTSVGATPMAYSAHLKLEEM